MPPKCSHPSILRRPPRICRRCRTFMSPLQLRSTWPPATHLNPLHYCRPCYHELLDDFTPTLLYDEPDTRNLPTSHEHGIGRFAYGSVRILQRF